MKLLGIAALVMAMAAPAWAQEAGGDSARGYVSGFGGAAWGGGNSTGSVLFEGGVRVAPHLMAFTNVGRFANLQGDLQPVLAADTTALSNQGVGVTATGTLPAWYGVGGLRAEFAANNHAVPYVLGAIGAARLHPTPQFTFTSGMLPDGTVPDVGTDITSTLASSGTLAAPASSTAFMTMLGGGVQISMMTHWAADIGYRYSRIAADTTLNATPLNTNVATFGVGYRF